MEDVVIIGGGLAGLNAALVLSWAGNVVDVRAQVVTAAAAGATAAIVVNMDLIEAELREPVR